MTAEPPPGLVMVENANHPGRTTAVDRARYAAVREAMLAALPASPPGLDRQEMVDAVASRLPESLFPGGRRAGWWTKCVQLDLEAKGLVARSSRSPLRWWRT